MSSPTAVASEVWRARDLLRNLISKELKVRYKGSVLGFAWSLVTPLLMAAIFTVVFLTFLRIPFGNGDFTTFFLAGYLMWQFFANSVNSAATSIIANGQLIKKVYFPRELIPFSLVASQGVHLVLALLATAPLFIYERGFHPELLPLVALAIVLLALFTAGMSMVLGALAVRFRDLIELLQVIMLAWFYLTPIIYSVETIRSLAGGERILAIMRINPMTWFAELFHTLLYGIPLPIDPADPTGINGVPHPPPGVPGWTTWAVCAGVGLVIFLAGYGLFRRSAVTFAKEV